MNGYPFGRNPPEPKKDASPKPTTKVQPSPPPPPPKR